MDNSRFDYEYYETYKASSLESEVTLPVGGVFLLLSALTAMSQRWQWEDGGEDLSDGDWDTLESEIADLTNALMGGEILMTGDNRIATIYDEKEDGVGGGTTQNDTELQRDLNTVSGDTEIVSVSSNKFTPIAGRYYVIVDCPVRASGKTRLRMTSENPGEHVAHGQTNHCSNAASVQGHARLVTTIETDGTTAYKVLHWTFNALADIGFGTPQNRGVAEIYTQVTLMRLSDET